MRILIATNSSPPRFVGGAELMADEQANALVRAGHEVRVLAGDLGSPYARHHRVDDLYGKIPYHRIATTPADYSPEYLNFLHPAIEDHFRDVLQDFEPDILHCHNLIGLSVKLPIIARRSGVRSVCTLHDFWGFCLRNTMIRTDGRACDDISRCGSCLARVHDGRALDIPLRFRQDFIRLALDHVDRFLSPSRHFADRYIMAGLSANRIMVVPNGVDVACFRPTARPADRGMIRITYAGYFGAHKGVATLIDAVAATSRPDVVLQLAGDGPEAQAYRVQADATGLGERLLFLGKKPPAAMPGVYNASDIVVLPSLWEENQPVCLMEAMAAGLPIVASQVGGIPELIDHGKNGFMFAPGDSIDLAAHLGKLMDEPALRQMMGDRGRRRVEGLSHDRQTARLLEIYDDILNPARRPAPIPPVTVALAPLDRCSESAPPLIDARLQRRYFIPYRWIVDCLPTIDGVVLSGRARSVLECLGYGRVVMFPRGLRRVANAALRRLAAHRRRAEPEA